MPANLTPQYHKAEEEYRRAQSPEDELRCLDVMLREIPKHKGTDKLQAELKHKISRAKAEVEQARKSGGKSKGAAGVKIPRQGAGRAVLIGGPNSGKSQLLAKLTRATPEIAPYPFTTREPQPGMMPWEDVMVQLIDTPPLTADMVNADVIQLVRGCDLAIVVVDLGADDGIEGVSQCLAVFAEGKTRLAKESYLDEEDIGVTYTKTIIVLNKFDDPEADGRLSLMREFVSFDFPEYRISADRGDGLDDLKKAIFDALDVVRVYTKLPHKKEADFEKPFTLKRGGTVLDVAELVHKDVAATFKHARIWGTGIMDGSTVKGDYVVHDKNVIEIHAGA
jgi:uncharacterized protein